MAINNVMGQLQHQYPVAGPLRSTDAWLQCMSSQSATTIIGMDPRQHPQQAHRAFLALQLLFHPDRNQDAVQFCTDVAQELNKYIHMCAGSRHSPC